MLLPLLTPVNVAPPGLAALPVEWQRAWAWWLLLFPLLLLLAARRPSRPPSVATGTVRIWRKVAERTHSDTGAARRRVPAWLVAACLSLVLAITALAEPRPRRAEGPRTWRVVLDRGVGMGLRWAPPAGASARDEEPGMRRGEVALASALELLGDVAAPDDRVRWTAEGRAPLTLPVGEAPPASWCLPVRSPSAGRPAWERHAEPGVVWVTDRAPDASPGGASLVVAGGAAVPGAVAAVGDELLPWNPEEDAPEPLPRERGALVLLRGPAAVRAEGPPLPPLLEALVRAWSGARALGPLRSTSDPATARASEDVVLVVEGLGSAEPDAPAPEGTTAFVLREPGLVARGRVAAPAPDPAWPGPPAEAALSPVWSAPAPDGGAPLPLAVSTPGWIRFHLVELEPPGGDPAAFALRLAALLDAALLPPPGVVPREARAAAGPRRVEPGAPPPPEATGARPRAGSLSTWACVLAALAAFVACLLRRVP